MTRMLRFTRIKLGLNEIRDDQYTNVKYCIQDRYGLVNRFDFPIHVQRQKKRDRIPNPSRINLKA